MKEIKITEKEAGQRLDKLLKKYLKEAPGSFIYKMLRKKNIVLNKRKAAGKELLEEGDLIQLYLSEETIDKFRGKQEDICQAPKMDLDVVYEDAHILLINKPAGILSQKASADDTSVVESIIFYLLDKQEITQKDLETFHPSICNRLDRNTTGILGAGKSLMGLQTLSRLFRERTVRKYYLCFAKGCISTPGHIRGALIKDQKRNKVTVDCGEDTHIETRYKPIAWNQEMTLLKVHLITGKTHQIRAHLAAGGHPILGDYKYGDRNWNQKYRETYQVKHQMLHAYCLMFPQMDEPFQQLSGQSFYAKVPRVFWRIIKETVWEHGIQEALEVRH